MSFHVPSQQIQQREKKDPDDVHKVPIQSGNLDRRVILGTKAPSYSHNQNHGHDSKSDDHVQRVHAGHRKINPIEQLDILHRSARLKMKLVLIGVARLGNFRTERSEEHTSELQTATSRMPSSA